MDIGSILVVLLVAALAGPFALGWVAGRCNGRPARIGVLIIAAALPFLLWLVLWFTERIVEHGGDLFGAQTDGDLGIIFAQFVSFALLPVSTCLAFLGQWRSTKRARRSSERTNGLRRPDLRLGSRLCQ